MENLWNTNNLENLVEINSGICLNQFCCRKGRSASCLASLSLPVHQGSGLLSLPILLSPPPSHPLSPVFSPFLFVPLLSSLPTPWLGLDLLA